MSTSSECTFFFANENLWRRQMDTTVTYSGKGKSIFQFCLLVDVGTYYIRRANVKSNNFIFYITIRFEIAMNFLICLSSCCEFDIAKKKLSLSREERWLIMTFYSIYLFRSFRFRGNFRNAIVYVHVCFC